MKLGDLSYDIDAVTEAISRLKGILSNMQGLQDSLVSELNSFSETWKSAASEESYNKLNSFLGKQEDSTLSHALTNTNVDIINLEKIVPMLEALDRTGIL